MSTACNVYVQRPQRPMTRGSFLTEVHLCLICRLHHTFKRPISSCIFIGKVEHLFTPYRWRCFHQTRGLDIRDYLVMMRRLERCNRCSCSKTWYPHCSSFKKPLFRGDWNDSIPSLLGGANKAWCRDFSAPEGSTVLLESQKLPKKKKIVLGIPWRKICRKDLRNLRNFGWS